MSCINAYIWSLEKWYWWIYFQGSSGDADIENRLMDTVGEGEGGTNWESSPETYALPYTKQIAFGNLLHDRGSSTWNSVTTWRGAGWDGVGDDREVQEGEDICIPVTGSSWQKYCKATQYGKAIIFQSKINKLKFCCMVVVFLVPEFRF